VNDARRPRLRRTLDTLVEPVASVTSDATRSTGRLIASMLLLPWVLCLLTLVAWAAAPDRYVADVEALLVASLLPCFVAAYVLARRGFPKAAAWVLILTSSGAIFASQFAALLGMNPIYHPADASALAFLVIPIFIASAILSRRATGLLAAIAIAATMCVPVLVPVVQFDQIAAGPALLVLVVAILAIAFSSHRERLEEQRASMLRAEIRERQAAQIELARHRDELELIVSERTENLEAAVAQLVEANDAKSRFMANMSHELRTPLNSIIGFTGVMKQELAGPLSDEQRRQLAMVDRSGRHLLGLINQVLDLSRIESGDVQVDHDSFDVEEFLTEVSDVVAPLAEAKSLTLSVECTDTGRSGRITTDRAKLHQILLNLLGNAIKFTDRGGVTLATHALGDVRVITVTDTGVGIAPEHLADVFDEYHQLNSAEGGKPQGTGLGLPVSRKLAMLLGGDIEVESEPGVGSRFSVAIARGQRASG
jgi:signal transduction histidine kinase